MLLIYVVHLLLVLKGHLNVCREQNSGKFCIVEQNSVLPDSCILVTAKGFTVHDLQGHVVNCYCY